MTKPIPKKALKPKPIAPHDVLLPEGVALEGGAICVTLKTLAELEAFWAAHRDQYAFAAYSSAASKDTYLRPYQWIFGVSKAIVASYAFRWDAVGIGCQWYNYSAAEPSWYAFDVQAQRSMRNDAKKTGRWSPADEARWLMFEKYGGWWTLTNLPYGGDAVDWLADAPQVNDPSLSIEEAKRQMKEQLFDEWQQGYEADLTFMTRLGMDEEVAYWRNEKALDEDYYGLENEPDEPDAGSSLRLQTPKAQG